ncbi:hypothetical protein CORMATOL_00799 [Corynebacterium matruchotii ATCC 33806]|jgi:hypothetical protein|uniref:Integrase catalytic domain-containing protein n=1 Tax=Corynebacterium matruchotii ATCC 33806 TaxID=566549 RepID=C0E1E8_9CORY|nr:hypothetical protein CORMATOL_00799 [Corynebacterium matruchotii ATCC 33806]
MKKRVFFDKNSFASMIQARAEIGEFIEGIYNRNHRHSTLGYQIPKHLMDQFFNRTHPAAPAA